MWRWFARRFQTLPIGLTVWVSLLQRCEQLAQALRGLQPDLIFKTDARLQKMNFCAWEGQRWDAIPRPELDAWTNNFAQWPQHAPGFGQWFQVGG
jgi:alpha-ribazole phosphatase